MSYAANTLVSTERTKAEIEGLLKKHGADSFFSGWSAEKNTAFVAFRMEQRNVRFNLPLPDRADYTKGRYSWQEAPAHIVDKKHEQATRARWRALFLVVKAKLEAVASGITSFEQEFLSHIQLPDGKTVHEWMKPQLDDAYGSGRMPLMLGSGE